MPRYEFSDGSSNKFWQIDLNGSSFSTTYGKIGASGQTTLKSFKDDAAAQKEYDKLIDEKIKKGYTLVSGVGPTVAVASAPAAKPVVISKTVSVDVDVSTSTKIAGKTVVVTGTFSKWKRPELEAILAKMGAKVTSSVSKKTDFLVVGVDAGSKLDKAEELGVECLEENEIIDLIEGSKSDGPTVAAAPVAPVPVAPAAKPVVITKTVSVNIAVSTSTKIAGKTVVVTGGFLKWKRPELEAILAKMGAKVTSSVSKKTDFLVVGADAGSKLEKAEELGVECLDEDEIIDLIEGGGSNNEE
jgi:NAD-dependent DNA ligase